MEGALPESRICFTSGNCQLMAVSAGFTVFTGKPGIFVATGVGRRRGIYPLEETSDISGGRGLPGFARGVASQARTRVASGGTQRNRSSTEISKIMVIVMSSHASRAMMAPAVPSPLSRTRARRLPIYPPPMPSMTACSAIASGMIECMVVSSHRKNRMIPVARSSESGGSFSIRRRISHMPIRISPTGRMYIPQPSICLNMFSILPVRELRCAENRIKSVSSPTIDMTAPTTSSLRSAEREFHQETETGCGGCETRGVDFAFAPDVLFFPGEEVPVLPLALPPAPDRDAGEGVLRGIRLPLLHKQLNLQETKGYDQIPA